MQPLFDPAIDAHAPDEVVRFAVVSQWLDADLMEDADISRELVGQRVMSGETDESLFAADASSVPGYLFTGDDGDSLWFWPESEELAFRFEPAATQRLRGRLNEDVSRLVSQGALVFCTRVQSATNDVEFEFPGVGRLAA